MISEYRHKLLISIIVGLAVLNISTLGTIAYHSYFSKLNTKSENSEKVENQSNQFNGRYFRDHLGFTQDQMAKFRIINPTFRHPAKQITIQLADIRKLMLIEMERENVDTSKLNQYSKEIGNLHAQFKVLTYKYFLDLKSICSSEQKVKLGVLFRNLFQMDVQSGFSGKGNGNGRAKDSIK